MMAEDPRRHARARRHHKGQRRYREDSAQSAKTAIERQNNEAASRAHSKRNEYASCLAAGGLWNFGAGTTALRSIVGTDLIGARGLTPADQRKIDRDRRRHLRRGGLDESGMRWTRGRTLNVAEIFVSDRTTQCLVWRRGDHYDRRSGRPADVAH
ncbi:hypothetical protein EMEDMD4_1280059 [Sinorhizobium medicae]|uniref:Uncharacterized protein n=1 Tax=Sinorhizobium medicae TaxID=110321 RepID=A0A508WRB2_9HYPH|nr:hypothetical protein EMEDMD4_1280059 [Sinorhizobium medicae]